MNRGILATVACFMTLALVGCGGETPKKDTKAPANTKAPTGEKK